jgi:hypothetical protein
MPPAAPKTATLNPSSDALEMYAFLLLLEDPADLIAIGFLCFCCCLIEEDLDTTRVLNAIEFTTAAAEELIF